MALTLALAADALEHIRPRLDALGLDLRLAVFDHDGNLTVDGAAAEPEATDVDFLWMSRHVYRPKTDRETARDAAHGFMERFRSIGVLTTLNAGLDDPFYARLAARGVTISNSSAQGVAIAEYVLGAVLAEFQRVETRRAQQAERRWKAVPFREISRTRWLIVGHGPIGSAVAVRAGAFGAALDVIRRFPAPIEGVDRVAGQEALADLAAEADVIVLACPLTEATRDMAGADLFARMKPDAVLVNVGRGGLVDEGALIAALDAGRPGTAVLDVFREEPLPETNPLWSHPKVRVTAHTSFAGDGTAGRWDDLFLAELSLVARGEAPARRVDPADIG